MLVATGEGGTLEAELSGSCGWEGTGPHPHDQVSPISYAPKIRTPVLIVHGEDDTNVPVSQAIYFHRALSWYGPSTNSSSTRVRDTGSRSAITSSTCSGARVHGSTGGFAMKRPMTEDHRLDQRAPCPALPHPGLTASIHGCERPHLETTPTRPRRTIAGARHTSHHPADPW
jgi:hypothetical protein